LADPANEPYRTNIVVTLGFIGHPTARPPLLKYLTETQGEVSLDQWRGLLAVPYALAHLAHQGDVTSLSFLLDASDPAYWANQPLAWSYQGQAYGPDLYEQTVLALGVSGLPQAQARLAEIAGQGGLSTQAGEDTLQQALDLNRRVQQEGMARTVTFDPADLEETLSTHAEDTNSIGHLQTFVVGRHSSLSYPDETRIDDILNIASEIMQTADSASDVACCVALQRDGPIGTFTTTDGIINTSTDMYAIFNMGAYGAKLVPALDYCGGYNPSIIGCAYINSPKNMILEHLSSLTLNGILWAHEFGHNQGLYHTNPADSTQIMNGYLSYSAKQMTQTECNAWHSSYWSPGTPGACPFGFTAKQYLLAGSEVTAGATINYTIEVKNGAFQQITGISVSDDLAGGDLVYLGPAVADPPGIIGDLTNFPDSTSFTLEAGESVAITYGVQVAATVTKGELLVNTVAVASADLSEPVQASYTAIVDPEKSFLPLILRNY
jgi:hypothetical protein